jgi:hypothetical protein
MNRSLALIPITKVQMRASVSKHRLRGIFCMNMLIFASLSAESKTIQRRRVKCIERKIFRMIKDFNGSGSYEKQKSTKSIIMHEYQNVYNTNAEITHYILQLNNINQ